MRLRYKRAIELSANFLVMMILSIAMLGFGVYFAKQLFTKSAELTIDIDKQTGEQIEQLLNDGSRVVLPFVTKTVRLGDLGVFGIGVLNTLEYDTNFYIQAVNAGGLEIKYPASGFDREGNEITDISVLQRIELVYNNAPVQIANLHSSKFALGANVHKDAIPGTYAINLRVRYYDQANNDLPYGDPLYKLYVVVP